MSDVIAVDRERIEAMIAALRQGAAQLETTRAEMQKIAQMMQDGALRGRAGNAFVDALTGSLAPAITRLEQKLEEVANDVYAAAIIGILGEADPDAEGIIRS